MNNTNRLPPLRRRGGIAGNANLPGIAQLLQFQQQFDGNYYPFSFPNL
jgi:hypothetical protein